MTQPNISSAAVPGPRDRVKICFGNKAHVEHLTTMLVLLIVNLALALHWRPDTMAVSTILSVGVRDLMLIIFFAEELL